MASKLDDMLEPGETVVWRDSGPGVWSFVAHTVMTAAVMATIFVAGPGKYDIDTWLGIFAWLLVPITVLSLIVHRPVGVPGLRLTEVMITNRRILWWHAHNEPPIKRMAFADIRKIVAVGYRDIAVRTEDGREILLHVLRKPQGSATALAKAANLARPPLVGRLANLAEFGLACGGPVCVILVLLLFGDLLGLHERWVSVSDWILRPLGAAVAYCISFFVGAHAMWMVGLVVLRPWVTAQEAANWLRRDKESGWVAGLLHYINWQNPLYFSLAHLLYGRPFGPQGKDVSNHG